MSDLPLPVQCLGKVLRAYPDLGKQVDDLLRGRGDAIPDWPDWCFVPMAGWIAIAQGDGPATLDTVRDAQLLASLGTWRYTQGIYRYDPDVLAALLHTDLTGDLPADMLLRLPEWSVYIEADLTLWGEDVAGYWAHLEYDVKTGHRELIIVAAHPNGSVSPTIAIHLGAGALADAIAATFFEPAGLGSIPDATKRDHAAQWARELTPFVSLVLYLCTDAPEIDDSRVPGVSPTRPRLTKTKRGWRLFAPDRARVWDVGAQTGEVIRRGRREAGEAGQRTVRPHIRRGHWHGYWYGPRTGEQIFRCRWLPPMVIAAGEEDM